MTTKFVSETPVKKAHDFLGTYYSKIRSKELGGTFCNPNFSIDTRNEVIEYYDSLDEATKAVVNGSTDFSYGKDARVDNWFTHQIDTSYKVGQSIEFIRWYDPSSRGNSISGLGLVLDLNNSESGLAVLIIVAAVVAALISLVVLKARKKHE